MPKIDVYEVFDQVTPEGARGRWLSLYPFQVKDILPIPGNKTHCIVVLDDDTECTIAENFEDLFIRLNDLKNGDVEEG